MTTALPSMLGAIGAGRDRWLIAAGQILPPVALQRAGVAARATALAAGGNWAEFTADLPRVTGAGGRLLIEGQRTNSVRNPRIEGAVAGTPGTLPTNISVLTSYRGLSQVVGAATKASGIDCFDWGATGTATATGTVSLQMEARTVIAAAVGEVWTGSVFLALPSGAPTNVTECRISIEECNAAGTPLLASSTTTVPLASLTATPQRFTVTRTIANASVAFITLTVTALVAATVATAWTLRIGWPQLERGAFASTPVLPQMGTPAAATRGTDLASAAAAALFGGAGTILLAAMLPQAAPAGADQLLIQLDDGTDANRIRLRNLAGGTTLLAGRVTGGASADAASLGAMTAGSLFRLGLSFDATGRVAACLAGGAVQVVSGAPTAGLTTLRLGNNAAGVAQAFGELARLSVSRTALSDAALAEAASAF